MLCQTRSVRGQLMTPCLPRGVEAGGRTISSELDLERLFALLTPNASCGRDLRDDPAFRLLQEAAEPGQEFVLAPDGREQGIPRRRDWAKIQRDALELLQQGRDLRVLVILIE